VVIFVFHNRRSAILLASPVPFCYEGLCLTRWGRTLGKRAVGTRVVPFRSARPLPSPVQAFVRAAVNASPVAVLFLVRRPSVWTIDLVSAAIWVPILVQRQRRSLPDLLAGTIVVKDGGGGDGGEPGAT